MLLQSFIDSLPLTKDAGNPLALNQGISWSGRAVMYPCVIPNPHDPDEYWMYYGGGDITYHGPGQIVGYPIFDLELMGLSVKSYIELLEDIEPDPEVIAACRSLKAKGYSIALDDFEVRPGTEPLIDLADIIKVDFLKTSLDNRAHVVKEFRPRGIQLLAEKVETHDDFHHALEHGYSLFQGFFFARPETLSRSDVPVLMHHYMQLLSLSVQPDPDFKRLEDVIKHDTSLCYRLLRYLNSAWFGFRREITSGCLTMASLRAWKLKRFLRPFSSKSWAIRLARDTLIRKLSSARKIYFSLMFLISCNTRSGLFIRHFPRKNFHTLQKSQR